MPADDTTPPTLRYGKTQPIFRRPRWALVVMSFCAGLFLGEFACGGYIVLLFVRNGMSFRLDEILQIAEELGKAAAPMVGGFALLARLIRLPPMQHRSIAYFFCGLCAVASLILAIMARINLDIYIRLAGGTFFFDLGSSIICGLIILSAIKLTAGFQNKRYEMHYLPVAQAPLPKDADVAPMPTVVEYSQYREPNRRPRALYQIFSYGLAVTLLCSAYFAVVVGNLWGTNRVAGYASQICYSAILLGCEMTFGFTLATVLVRLPTTRQRGPVYLLCSLTAIPTILVASRSSDFISPLMHTNETFALCSITSFVVGMLTLLIIRFSIRRWRGQHDAQ